MARRPRPDIDTDHIVLARIDGSTEHGMTMTYVAHQAPVDDYSPRLYITRLLNGSDGQTIVVRPADLPVLEAAVAALRNARFETPKDDDSGA